MNKLVGSVFVALAVAAIEKGYAVWKKREAIRRRDPALYTIEELAELLARKQIEYREAHAQAAHVRTILAQFDADAHTPRS